MKSDPTVVASVSGNWQTETSLIRTDAGGIFKENAQSTIYYYSVTDYTYTQATVTVDWGSFSSFTGTVDLNLL
jgi:hypothetical protein